MQKRRVERRPWVVAPTQLPRRREHQRRINQKCWCCSEPIGDLCDGQLESFMAAIVNSCRFRRYGCDEALQYTEKRGHEETCEHAPFDSPFGAVAATQACNSLPTSRTYTCGDLIHIFLYIFF